MPDREVDIENVIDVLLSQLALSLSLGRGRVISIAAELLGNVLAGDLDQKLKQDVERIISSIRDKRTVLQIAQDELELSKIRTELGV